MLGRDSFSIQTNMIPILCDMTPTYKTNAANRKLPKLENKKINISNKIRNFVSWVNLKNWRLGHA
jgi:hypothetical protein